MERRRASQRNKSARKRTPRYCRQKRTGRPDLAYVEFAGSRCYLGEYGSKESRAEYRRLVAEWSGASGRAPERLNDQLTVVEVIARFWEHAQVYYRRADGTPTSEVANFKTALRTLKELYGHTKAGDFGPRSLKAIRSHLVKRGLARTTVNAMTKRIRSVFKWAVSEELVPPSVHHGLQAVSGLKRGRSEARETSRVLPVPEEFVEAVRPYVSRQVWTLIQLQKLSGARSGEILGLRPRDIDTSGEVWSYSPPKHKTAHHDHSRELFFGPKAQALLRQWMESRPLAASLFSPADAETERRAQQHAERKTPLRYGNRPGTNRKESPRRTPRDCYTVDSYGRAIRRACEKAGIPPWHPHQLRHNAGTEIRKQFGIETTRIVLGHQSVVVSELYAERDRAIAIDVMGKLG